MFPGRLLVSKANFQQEEDKKEKRKDLAELRINREQLHVLRRALDQSMAY